MYIMPTNHYKGGYPVNFGAITFYSGPFTRKEVDDVTGARLLKSLYPMVVECDINAKPVKPIPEVTVVKEIVAPVVPVETKSVDETAASESDGEVLGAPQDQPVVEEVAEGKKSKKGK